MKIAVLSDVHGFSPALKTVLEDIRTKGVDQIVVAGDICAGGPDPAGSIQLLEEHDCSAIYGNTDRDLLNNSPGDDELTWTRDQLSASDIEWLQRLPFSVRIPHPDHNLSRESLELLVVHANPVDVDLHLSPNASEPEVLDIIGDETARTIAFGHLHVAYSRQVGPYMLVDVSAVGSPRDQDLRPRYVIFESEASNASWSHEFHYLDYPLETTRAMMAASGMPEWEAAWRRLIKSEYGRQI